MSRSSRGEQRPEVVRNEHLRRPLKEPSLFRMGSRKTAPIYREDSVQPRRAVQAKVE